MAAQRKDAFGGQHASQHHEREALIGMAEIERYTGFTEPVLKKLAEERGFPMQLLGGKWVASKRRIDEWFYNLFPSSRSA